LVAGSLRVVRLGPPLLLEQIDLLLLGRLVSCLSLGHRLVLLAHWLNIDLLRRSRLLVSSGFLILRVPLLEANLLDPDHDKVEGDDAVVKWEDLYADGELLLLHEGCCELVHLVFQQGNHFLLIHKVDRQREDRSLERGRDQRVQILPQLFFSFERVLGGEAAGVDVFHKV